MPWRFPVDHTMDSEAEGRLFYYCSDNETVEGPHTWEQLLELLGDGDISPSTAICEAGSKEWTTFGSYMLAEEQVLAAPFAVAG